MKSQQGLFRNCAIALLCFSSFSCIDNNYDLTNLSSKAELFKNSLSLPVGTAKIYLDSVIGGMDVDTTILTVKNGMYVFSYSGSVNIGNLSSTFNAFSLKNVDNVESNLPIYDATSVPESALPIPLPLVEAEKTHSGDIDILLPESFGSTDLIDIDSVSLTNTYIQISSECFGLEGGNGKNMRDILEITFTAEGEGADYFIQNPEGEWEKSNSWTIRLGETSIVEVRKLRLTTATNKLTLRRNIKVKFENDGDVLVTDNIYSYVHFKMEFINGIDFNLVWGKVHYETSGEVPNIHFEGLNKITNENDVLSIYNPTMTLNSESNLGVPVDLDINMGTSNSVSGKTANLTDTRFHMSPSDNPEVMKINTFTLNKDNGTGELFKINPDLIRFDYNVQTDPDSNSFIAKNTQLSMSYKMEVPLQFGGDLQISVDTTMDNPFKDNLDKLEDQDSLEVSILLDIINRIPLGMQIELEAVDKHNDSLFTVSTDPIEAAVTDANGFATDSVVTATDITLTPEQIDKIKDTEMFRVRFVVTARQNAEFVTVQPSDYIILKIGGKINGGVILDISGEKEEEKP